MSGPVWYTWVDGGHRYGAAYSEAEGWHVVGPLFKPRRLKKSPEPVASPPPEETAP